MFNKLLQTTDKLWSSCHCYYGVSGKAPAGFMEIKIMYLRASNKL